MSCQTTYDMEWESEDYAEHLMLDVEYNWSPGFKGSFYSPPEPPELEIESLSFFDKDSKKRIRLNVDDMLKETIEQSIRDEPPEEAPWDTVEEKRGER